MLGQNLSLPKNKREETEFMLKNFPIKFIKYPLKMGSEISIYFKSIKIRLGLGIQ
jgi:hypothetical protein